MTSDDESAFEIIFRNYYSRLYYFAFEFVPYDDLVENIVQDTFLTLWNKRRELAADTSFSAYLYTVTRNNCLFRLRSEKYRRKLFAGQLPELELNAGILATLDTSDFTFGEIEWIIQETLGRLPAQCRNVFLLRLKALKNREIADELGISEKVVEKHISKGLKAFRGALKDYLPLINYFFV